MKNEEILGLLAQYDKEIKALKFELYKMCWYSRGGINLDQMFMMSPTDREILRDVIEYNLEITKETKLPHF